MSSTELSKELALIRNFDINPVLFSQDDAGVYEIQGFDKFMTDADRVIEISRNADFTEDDRKNIKDARAFLNTVTKVVNRQVIDEKSRLFDTIDEQRKDIASKIKELTSELSSNLDKWDAQQREIAYNEVLASFNDAMYFKNESAGVDLAELNFDAINESSWFNRSASRKKVIATMNERIDSVSTLLAMAESRSLDDVVSILVSNDWNLGAAIQSYNAIVEEERAAAAAAEAEAKRRAEELAEAERRGREAALKEMEAQNAEAVDDTVDESNDDESAEEEVGTVILTVTYPDNQSISDSKIMKIVKRALDDAGVQGVYIS